MIRIYSLPNYVVHSSLINTFKSSLHSYLLDLRFIFIYDCIEWVYIGCAFSSINLIILLHNPLYYLAIASYFLYFPV